MDLVHGIFTNYPWLTISQSTRRSSCFDMEKNVLTLVLSIVSLVIFGASSKDYLLQIVTTTLLMFCSDRFVSRRVYLPYLRLWLVVHKDWLSERGAHQDLPRTRSERKVSSIGSPCQPLWTWKRPGRVAELTRDKQTTMIAGCDSLVCLWTKAYYCHPIPRYSQILLLILG